MSSSRPYTSWPTAPSLPRDLYTAAGLRRLEHLAIQSGGIPGIELMRRAGAAAFKALQEHWPQTRRLLLFAGGGNNGGDGYIMAALTRQRGLQVRLVCLSPPAGLRGEAAAARDEAAAAGVVFTPAAEFFAAETEAAGAKDAPQPGDALPPGGATELGGTVVVDALLGIGLDRPVKDAYQQAIRWINAAPVPVLAVDIPSGLHADTGCILGEAVRADVTVTFIGMKQGLLTGRGRDCAGRILFAGLDVALPEQETGRRHRDAPPPDAVRFDISGGLDLSLDPLPRRRPSAHKGDCGHLVVLGGERGYGGAGLLTAEAAARSGAGLVSLITRSVHRAAVLARRPEVMVLGTEDDGAAEAMAALLQRADALCIGPGLGRGEWGRGLFRRCLAAQAARGVPLVCDADGLFLLAEEGRENGGAGKGGDEGEDRGGGGTGKGGGSTAADKRREKWVLTPHPGEAARLLGISTEEVQEDRFKAVRRLQQTYGGTCLLKGSGSLCWSGTGPIGLCSEGNAGMASGGMGDVLAGVISGLLVQGLPPAAAVRLGAAVHGEAADLASTEAGERGLLAADLLPFLRLLVNPNRGPGQPT